MCFCRSLSVGTKTGYRLFSVTAVDKLDCIHEGGNKEPFTNMHLTSLHNSLVTFPSCGCGQIHFLQTSVFMHADSRQCSQFSICLHQKWHSESVWAKKSLTWSKMHTIKGEAPVFTFMTCAGVLNLHWNIIHCFSKPIQMENPLPVSLVESPDVYIVERLFSSSLVVVVSLSMPRRMNVYHFKKGTEICNYSYSNNILSVRLNRQVRTGNSSISEPVASAYRHLLGFSFLSLWSD